MATKVKIVTTTLSTDSAGNVVDAMPVRDAFNPTLNEVGKYVDPIEVEISADGSPIRYAAGLLSLNSAGKTVPVVPIFSGLEPYDPLSDDELDPYAYWDVNITEKITKDGSNLVSSYLDLISGHDVTASGATMPTYDPVGLDGDPCITYGGTQYLTGLIGSVPVGAAPCEILFYGTQDTPASDSTARYAVSYGNGTASDRRLRRTRTTGPNTNRAGGFTGNGTTGILSLDTTVDFSGLHFVRNIYEATRTGVSVNGGPISWTDVVPATASNRLRHGASSASAASGQWIGKQAVIAITPRRTDEQIARFLSYLTNGRGGPDDVVLMDFMGSLVTYNGNYLAMPMGGY